jgi:hypothetical protein
MCGHKDLNTKLDGKPFGFPFDLRMKDLMPMLRNKPKWEM